MMELWYWARAHVKPQFFLTPFASRNVVYGGVGGHTGFTDYFIFGVRIVRLQRTTPW